MSSPNKVNEYITDFLINTVGECIKNKHRDHEKVNKLIESNMGILFERYITGNGGDKIPQVFLVSEAGVPCAYNGKSYEEITPELMQYAVKRTMYKANVGEVYQFNSHKKIADECMLALLSEPSCRFEPNRRYAIFNNVVLDIETGEMYNHDVKYRSDMTFDFDYQPDYKFAFWEDFVKQTISDEGMRKAFQMYCGAFLANRNKYKIEYICLLVGKGANGKSVMAKAIVGVFNSKLSSSYSPEQLFKSSQKEYFLADIDGKVVNYCDDVSNKDFSGGDFKAFTSGAEFTGRHAYSRRPMKVKNVPLMLCCVNEIPPTTDDTDGYYRRLLPVLCPNVVSEDKRDVTLPQKLASNEAKLGIFNWLLEGYRMLVANEGKVIVSESIKKTKESIKNESNSVRRWISEEDMIAVEPEGRKDIRWKPLKEWLKMYKEFCDGYNERPNTSKKVGQIFDSLNFIKERRASGMWYCIGKKEDKYTTERVEMNVEESDDFPF